MNTYFRILKYAKRYRKHLAVSIFCTIMFAGLNGLSVYLTVPLLSALFQESSNVTNPVQETGSSILPDFITSIVQSISDAFHAFIFSGDVLESLFRMCIIILAAFLLKNIFGFFQSYFLVVVEQGLIRDLRNEAYEHLHTLPMRYFKNERVGNLISRIMNDIHFLQNSISATFLNIIREPLSILVFLGIALGISWKMTLFALLILPFSMLIIGYIGSKLRKQSAVVQAKTADVTSILQETISNVKIVKAFANEPYEIKKFNKETERFFRLMLHITRVRNLSSPLTEALSVIVGASIIYYGGQLVLVDHSIKASEFLGFLFAIFQMMPPIKELSTVANRIQESSAAADRVFEIIDAVPDIISKPGAVNVTEFTDAVEYRGVGFSYDDGDEHILQDVSLSVKKGEIVAIVGPSGGGKTTFVDLLPRFHDPTYGSITIDGIDTKDISLPSLRGLIGIVTQETILFNDTIRANIAYGLDGYSLEKIQEAAAIANAHQFVSELPSGYDTIIGERGVKLSGGQRQRLAIARVLLKDPPIMIFDEATSALDNESEVVVQEAIDRLMQRRTVFVIAHRLSTIRNADKIVVLEKGKVVQCGTHEELIENERGLYKKLYDLQFRD